MRRKSATDVGAENECMHIGGAAGIESFMLALQRSQDGGGLPLMPPPAWAQAQFDRVRTAFGGRTAVDVAVCPVQAEALRLYASDYGDTGRPVVAMRPSYLAAWSAKPSDPRVLLSLAHELGHFTAGHLDLEGPLDDETRRGLELEADRWAGFAGHRLGLKAADVEDWIDGLSNPDGCRTHPPHDARRAAALAGWRRARGY